MDAKKLKILIADDEEGLRFSMGGILELEGHDVVLVGNGQEAIDQARTHSFDIAFLDVKMPVMNGVDAFREIKRLSPETIVIMMTAFAVKDLIKDAIHEGAYACMSKPFDMDFVIETIKEVAEKPFVVVIDDDPSLCSLLYDRFRENGFNVVTRASGAEGLELVSRRIPDVVFLDVVMDGMDGIATLKKLKETLGKNCPRTILMSAHEMKHRFDEARRLGAVECLNKPLDLDALGDTIKNMTARAAKPKICIVYDNKAMRETMQDVLTKNGYEVDVASSGSEVIGKIREGAFTILVLDVRLPGTSGLEVYERVKKRHANVGVVFVTGSADENAREIIRKNNYVHLPQPFEPEELIKTIEHVRGSKK